MRRLFKFLFLLHQKFKFKRENKGGGGLKMMCFVIELHGVQETVCVVFS